VGELFPFLAGLLAGVGAIRLPTRRLRATCVAALSVAFGVVATLVNSEELVMVPVDTVIVGVTGFGILAGPRFWARGPGRAPVAGRDERRAEG
jgi:peptidoglycan/LPS O-acetylase OafA/YrhL